MKTAAIYARVSSDKQREENTIASQTSALIAFAREQNCDVPTEWVIEDDGYSGASLELCGILGDGVNQAADFFSDATSIPSRNITPLTTFGN